MEELIENRSMSQMLRETDHWMKRLALYGPAIALIFGFFTGFGSGILTASVMYRDHEQRVTIMEKWHVAQEQWDYDAAQKITALETLARHHLR